MLWNMTRMILTAGSPNPGDHVSVLLFCVLAVVWNEGIAQSSSEGTLTVELADLLMKDFACVSVSASLCRMKSCVWLIFNGHIKFLI